MRRARFQHLANRIFNTVHAIHPAKAAAIVAAIGGRLDVSGLLDVGGERIVLAPMAFDQEMENEAAAERRCTDNGYDIVAGAAIIQVEGTLVQKNGTMRPFSGMTGYDGIRQAFWNALGDPEAKAIVFEVDSPGGEVAGCFDLVDLIYSKRGEKPIWSIVAEHAYSAAYAIASAAEFVTVPRTGGTGSVGCIMLHADFSAALEDAGIKVTLIKYGDRKADGNPYQALSKEALADAQRDIDALGEIFVETVARNRGLDVAKVRGTQAATYMGEQSLDIGFADAVMAPEEEALPALLNELG